MTTVTDHLTVYVYYKIPVTHHASCLLAVKQVQQAVALRYPAVMMSLQKRPDPDATHQETWMEIYTGIAPGQLDGFMADLLALAEAQGLPRERRDEVFIHLQSN